MKRRVINEIVVGKINDWSNNIYQYKILTETRGCASSQSPYESILFELWIGFR